MHKKSLRNSRFLYIILFIFFFIFGCVGSLLLHVGCLVAASRGYSLAVVYRLLIAGASLIAEHGL